MKRVYSLEKREAMLRSNGPIIVDTKCREEGARTV